MSSGGSSRNRNACWEYSGYLLRNCSRRKDAFNDAPKSSSTAFAGEARANRRKDEPRMQQAGDMKDSVNSGAYSENYASRWSMTTCTKRDLGSPFLTQDFVR